MEIYIFERYRGEISLQTPTLNWIQLARRRLQIPLSTASGPLISWHVSKYLSSVLLYSPTLALQVIRQTLVSQLPVPPQIQQPQFIAQLVTVLLVEQGQVAEHEVLGGCGGAGRPSLEGVPTLEAG